MARRTGGDAGVASLDTGGGSVLARAMRRFTAAVVLVLLIIAVATVLVARSSARDIALREATDRGARLARIMHPSLQVGELSSPGSANSRELDRQIRPRLNDNSLLQVRVWSADGRVVWSDEPEIRGSVRPLNPSVKEIFGTREVVAAMSDSPAGDQERVNGRTVLEVHVGTTSVDDVPLVIESYWSADMVEANTRAIMSRMAPLAVGALLLFALLVFPLARSLARRVHQAQHERRRLMQHALSASDMERRRIAQDLHDGVMQELSGAGYALSAAAAALPADPETSRRMIDQVTAVLHDAGASLRSLLPDIYPPNLEAEGLQAAVAELAARTQAAGIKVRTDVADLSDIPLEATQLSYRVIREGLHNAQRHAHAEHVEVAAACRGAQVFISVADDGRGPTESATEEGHFGLRMLTETLQDLGGTLRLGPRPGGGAVLTASFSTDFASD
jgi:signal transduction histidine kinase